MLNSSQTRPPAHRRRGCRCPGRRSLPTPASPLPSPFPQRAAVAGGRPGRAPRTHRARGEREPHRSAGPLSDSAASVPCAPPSWEPGQAARCVITSERRSARGRSLPPMRSGAPPPPAQSRLRQRLLSSGRRATCGPGSGPIGTLRGKIASPRHQ